MNCVEYLYTGYATLLLYWFPKFSKSSQQLHAGSIKTCSSIPNRSWRILPRTFKKASQIYSSGLFRSFERTGVEEIEAFCRIELGQMYFHFASKFIPKFEKHFWFWVLLIVTLWLSAIDRLLLCLPTTCVTHKSITGQSSGARIEFCQLHNIGKSILVYIFRQAIIFYWKTEKNDEKIFSRLKNTTKAYRWDKRVLSAAANFMAATNSLSLQQRVFKLNEWLFYEFIFVENIFLLACGCLFAMILLW